MSLRESLPPDVELIWDPTPDDDGVKRGDSFCFLRTGPDGEKTFWKEYPYHPIIITRYHVLQNRLAQKVNSQNLCLETGKRVQVLLLPEEISSFWQRGYFLSPHDWCQVDVPYVAGENVPHDMDITGILQNIFPGMNLQRIHPANCRETSEATVVTDIAWDIPGFLWDNPSENTALNNLVAQTYATWSQNMYQIYPFLGRW